MMLSAFQNLDWIDTMLAFIAGVVFMLGLLFMLAVICNWWRGGRGWGLDDK